MPSNLRFNCSTGTRRNTTPMVRILLGLCLLPLAAGCTPHPAPSVTPAPVAPQSTLEQVRAAPSDLSLRLALSGEYSGKGETFAAIEQLEVARTLAPTDPSLLRTLAQQYDQVGEPEAAAQTLAPAAANQDIALLRAQLCLQMGDFQGAAEAFRPLLRGWTTLPDQARQNVVRTYLLAGDAETGAHLLAAAPIKAEWQALAGLQALIAGNPRQAVADLKRARELDPQDTWNGYLLGRAWLASGDSRRALEVWLQVAQAQDAPPAALIGAARLLAGNGRLDQADLLLDRVRGDDRKLPAYWQTAALIAQRRNHPIIEQVALGYAAYNQGDPWQAEAIWSRTLPQADDTLAQQIAAALSNSAARRFDGPTALRYATQAAKRWPRDPQSLRQQADMLLAQNQPAEAVAVAQRFQTLAPPEQQAQAAELLARTALDASRTDVLQQSVQRYRSLAPNDPLPLLRLAEWQAQQGHDTANLERTLALYREASRIDPTNAEAAARAGQTLADLNRTAEATTTLLHALTLNPRVLDGAPNARLAQIYQRDGRTAESRFETAWYQRVRNLKETWPSLLKTLRQQSPAPGSADWKALGEVALRRHENWIALCAFTRFTRLAPRDPAAWRGLAAAQKRFGWFDEALDSMCRAHRLPTTPTTSAQR